MKTFNLLVLLAVAILVIDAVDGKKFHFKAFEKKYKKKYASHRERKRAINVTGENLKEVKRLNDLAKKLRSTARYSMNSFADLDSATFVSWYTGVVLPPKSNIKPKNKILAKQQKQQNKVANNSTSKAGKSTSKSAIAKVKTSKSTKLFANKTTKATATRATWTKKTANKTTKPKAKKATKSSTKRSTKKLPRRNEIRVTETTMAESTSFLGSTSLWNSDGTTSFWSMPSTISSLEFSSSLAPPLKARSKVVAVKTKLGKSNSFQLDP